LEITDHPDSYILNEDVLNVDGVGRYEFHISRNGSLLRVGHRNPNLINLRTWVRIEAIG